MIQKEKVGLILLAFIAFAGMYMQYAKADVLTEPVGEEESADISPELKDELERLSNEMDFSSWQEYYDELSESWGALGEYDDVKDMIESLATGDTKLGTENIEGAIKEIFLPGLQSSIAQLICIIALGLLSGLCTMALGDDKGTKQVLMLIISGTAILSITALFVSLINEAAQCMNRIAQFCSIAAPVLTGLLTALGCAGSAKLLNPALIILTNIILVVILKVILPMLLAGGILNVINGLTDRMKLSRSVKLINSTVKWVLGLITTVYIAFNTIGGISAGATDNITLRTTRYAIDRLVPAVGGMVSGAIDAVMGGAAMLKNAAGITAILIVISIVLRPALKLLAGMLALRIAAAIIEPFASPEISGMLDGTADVTSFLFASVSAAVSMLIVTIMIIIYVGNALPV